MQAADLYAHVWYAFLENGPSKMGLELYQAWKALTKRRAWMRLAEERFFERALATLTSEQHKRLKAGT